MVVVKPNTRTRGVELGDTGWFFDVTSEASVQLSSKIAVDPVEDGSDINDHITLDAIRLTLAGIKTATPLDELERRPGRLEDTFNQMKEIRAQRGTLEVFSPTFGTFPSMAISNISYSLTQAGGLVHTISMELIEFRIANFESTIVPAFFPKKKRVGGLSSAQLAALETATNGAKDRLAIAEDAFRRNALEFNARQASIADKKDILREQTYAYLDNPEVSDREKDLMRQKIDADPNLKAIIFPGAAP